MKIFAIRDEYDESGKNLAYLFYYEHDKKFYIELPENVDEWETPLILSSLLKKGEKTINSYWSLLWVRERIIPSDRQNLGQILKSNGLEEYDEFQLLMLAQGRCAQDDYYLAPLSEKELPYEILSRSRMRVEDVIPSASNHLLVFFRDGATKRVDIMEIVKTEPHFSSLLRMENYFKKVNVLTGGYGVTWGDKLEISDKKLYENGKNLPLSINDFKNFLQDRVMDTTQVASYLDCSRQNVNDLVQRGKLNPVKKNAKNTLFLKAEVMERNWI